MGVALYQQLDGLRGYLMAAFIAGTRYGTLDLNADAADPQWTPEEAAEAWVNAFIALAARSGEDYARAAYPDAFARHDRYWRDAAADVDGLLRDLGGGAE